MLNCSWDFCSGVKPLDDKVRPGTGLYLSRGIPPNFLMSKSRRPIMKQLRYVRKGYVNDDGGTKRKFSHQSTNKKLSGERRFCHELAKRALLRSLHPLPSCVEVGTAPVWQRVQDAYAMVQCTLMACPNLCSRRKINRANVQLASLRVHSTRYPKSRRDQ